MSDEVVRQIEERLSELRKGLEQSPTPNATRDAAMVMGWLAGMVEAFFGAGLLTQVEAAALLSPPSADWARVQGLVRRVGQQSQYALAAENSLHLRGSAAFAGGQLSLVGATRQGSRLLTAWQWLGDARGAGQQLEAVCPLKPNAAWNSRRLALLDSAGTSHSPCAWSNGPTSGASLAWVLEFHDPDAPVSFLRVVIDGKIVINL